MSNQSVLDFFAQASQNPELISKLKSLVDPTEIIAVAESQGFIFTEAELLGVQKQKLEQSLQLTDELSESQLETVAGGVRQTMFMKSNSSGVAVFGGGNGSFALKDTEGYDVNCPDPETLWCTLNDPGCYG